jgi:hypothetical protein
VTIPATHPHAPAAHPLSRSWTRLTLALGARALRHPTLALDLLRVLWNFRARGWWRRPPFLPLPPREYVRWRMHTAYGDHDAIPPADDIARYARWVAGRSGSE